MSKKESWYMHLDAFIEARVDDDERRARDAMERLPMEDSRLTVTGGGLVGATGWRVLAEAAMKRVMLFEHDDVAVNLDREPRIECVTCKVPYPCQSLRVTAAVYSDHPRYNPEWKPDPDTSMIDG